jgi:hypothetical protein
MFIRILATDLQSGTIDTVDGEISSNQYVFIGYRYRAFTIDYACCLFFRFSSWPHREHSSVIKTVSLASAHLTEITVCLNYKNRFFGLNSYLAEITVCLNYKNCFFGLSDHTPQKNTACLSSADCFFGFSSSHRNQSVSIAKTVSLASAHTSQRSQFVSIIKTVSLASVHSSQRSQFVSIIKTVFFCHRSFLAEITDYLNYTVYLASAHLTEITVSITKTVSLASAHTSQRSQTVSITKTASLASAHITEITVSIKKLLLCPQLIPRRDHRLSQL